ncbi:MAG TPA: alpha/beta hydrolase [Syntrophales bacterium]|nr:alpha/beta hydrolase [Syntrophales bacterium]HRV41688.1 alpha/beta hydrolase [Syntrophales bacterium]
MDYETKVQKVGETSIAYLYRPTAGPPLVFLHATGFHPHLWIPIARELSPPFAVVAPYFCDHREGEAENGGVSWLVLAEDLASFLEGLAITQPYLVGHSMGATVITLACAHFGVRPRRLVLIEPIFLPEDLYRLGLKVDQHPLASRALRRLNSWPDRERAREYLGAKDLFKGWDEEMLALYINHGLKEGEEGDIQLTCSPRREASLFMGGMAHDPWPSLPSLTCPTLILEGEESENRGFIDLKKATALLPQGVHRLVPGTGHLLPMEKPRLVASLIRDFFGVTS